MNIEFSLHSKNLTDKVILDWIELERIDGSAIDLDDVDDLSDFETALEDITTKLEEIGAIEVSYTLNEIEDWASEKAFVPTLSQVEDLITANNIGQLKYYEGYCEDLNYFATYDSFENSFEGEYSSMAEYAQEMNWDEVPERFKYHIDWESYADDNYSDYYFHDLGFIYRN